MSLVSAVLSPFVGVFLFLYSNVSRTASVFPSRVSYLNLPDSIDFAYFDDLWCVGVPDFVLLLRLLLESAKSLQFFRRLSY